MLHTKLAPLLKNDPELKANITFLGPINNFLLQPLLKVSQLRKPEEPKLDPKTQCRCTLWRPLPSFLVAKTYCYCKVFQKIYI